MEQNLNCGIYLIINKITGMVYVGSTKKFKARWIGHRSGLRKNDHKNAKLQNAWNKYGESNFEFCPISFCKEDELTKKEEYFINFFKPLGIYNLNLFLQERVVCSYETRLKLSKPFKIKDPNGQIYEGINLFQFAKEMGLNYNSLRAVKKGLAPSCFGWTFIFEKDVPINYNYVNKTFKFKDPQGVIHETRDLTKFVATHNLSYDSMNAIHNKRQISYKGWRRVDGEPLSVLRFQDSNGQIHECDNVRAFAKSTGLKTAALYSLINGRRNSCHGWTLAS